MKNVINRTAVLVALALAGVAGAQAQVTPGSSISYDWRFDTSANPAAPESSTGGGSPQATIFPGQFAEGALSGDSVLGPLTGLWDLGKSGTIVLTDALGAPGQARQVTVSVTQFHDGGIYSQTAAVTIQGATLLGSTTRPVTGSSGLVGAWNVQQTQWQIDAANPVNTVVVAGAATGTIIDEVKVESSSGVAQPPQLSIQRVGPKQGQIQISWPASYSNMILEASSNLSDPQGWAAVQDQVVVSGDTASVTLNAAGAAQLYRLKLP